MSENKGGRPSLYKPEYAKQAYKLCLLGAIDRDLADFFEVCETTIDNWKLEHPGFKEALRRGKKNADANVANALYKRALGYRHKAVKIVADANTGKQNIVPYVEHYPPDTGACAFWLKNRAGWRDKHEVEHSGELPTLVVKREE